ncbi:organic cation transporter protein-like isoform X2 [Bacillus rossius redtenbacheri]|uniref:organic cation transporter protein-like isoform X2 n=1 Tax=Bacillus rossius redtenbacheri TaxID=93214 RepID=UPI002FDC962C
MKDAVLEGSKPGGDCARRPDEPPQPGEEEDDDPVSRAVGEFGRWQLRLTFLLSLFNVPCTFHIFALTFQSLSGDFWCARPAALRHLAVAAWRNLSEPAQLDGQAGCRLWDLDYSAAGLGNFSAANRTRACTSWEYDHSSVGSTIISEWDLVCDRQALPSVAEMMFLTGVALGGLISGMISDRFGRKTTLMGSLVLQISIAVSMTFCPWLELYMALRFCLGFISVGIVMSGFVLCMELVGGKWRTISGVSYLFPVPLSYIAIACIAYFIRDWKHLQLAITLPSVLLFALWWVLPESPRWLLEMGRKDEVMAILQEAARVNQRPLPANTDKIFQQMMEAKRPGEEKAGVLDLFRTPHMRKISLVLYVIWFAVYLVYYGLVLNLANIGGDVYVNTVISGAVEIPSIAISILILLKMGRRWPLCLTLVGGGVACLLTLAVPAGRQDLEWLTITFAMVGKFAVACSNAIMPVFTAELFPTVVRNLGVGSSNLPAGVALMTVPYLWNLSSISARVPMSVLGVLGVVGGLSTLLLPETANKPMPGTLQEGEDIAHPRKNSVPVVKRSSNGTCNGSFAE